MAEGQAEIIIVRRSSEEEHAHHGGVWKIALADFMTTLMALFLVLWLIKASNEETKTSIANYFNPISLSDALPMRKGLNDPEPNGVNTGPGNREGAGSKDSTADSSARPPDKGSTLPPGSVTREHELFQDPYAVLANLATQPEPDKPQSATIGDLGEAGRRGGDVPRDPFDPLYWQVTTVAPARTDRPAAAGITPLPAQAKPDVRGAGISASKEAESKPAEGRPEDAKAAQGKSGEGKSGENASGESRGGDAAADRLGQTRGENGAAAQAALKAEIARMFPSSAPGTPGPRVDVQGTPEGVLINVTDDLNFSMFAVGSAEPRPEMVRAMERIGKALAARPGRIIVRGHTDSRPFRSEVYDNWRLSTARAHMASYMLTRAGLDEGRIWRVEGAAERSPRNAADPKAPENRRIEILLQGSPG
ncbi:MotB family protein [Methylobacterium sp. J-070]|uniref:MotB family protein n=1 Tax=Methylobacterium sp. J-070 TaxID=2836650 RepID=UPI001FBBD2C2|nr:MotB family protein [Methylobacterium sp. J-070]MCJ2048622.1 MotB family protein [Methylobacterium sp. J-070]